MARRTPKRLTPTIVSILKIGGGFNGRVEREGDGLFCLIILGGVAVEICMWHFQLDDERNII